MANYPSLDQLPTSNATTASGIRVDRAVSGKARAQNFYAADVHTFIVRHLVDSTDKGTLDTHYSGDKDNEFSFTWGADSGSFTVIYNGAPQYTPIKANLYKVVVKLEEVS